MKRLHRLTLVPVLALAWSGLLLAGSPPAQADPPDLDLCPWMDTSLTSDQRADSLLEHSTLGQTMRWLNEQASNLPQQTTWSGGVTYEAALPCTPTVYYTDGPEGVRHSGATTFPSQLGLAATWDQDLALAKGDAQGAEAYALGYNGVLAPGVASGRTPLSGRTPEYLGEDSLLSGLMAGQQLVGLQQNPVITSLKH
ncbi:MAG: hypothetical protein LBJ44_07060, partial [Propionibacteriaceae bacterium]|nr:hypothetical protein [Propionibacteriaceae bacterium]